MFGQGTSAFRPSGSSLFSSPATSSFGGIGTSTTAASHNPMKDFEVTQPPDDSIQALKFSPPALQQNFLVSGSWDGIVRVWEVKQDGSTEPKAQQTMEGPVLEADWSDDGSKIFVASADKKAKMWDIGSNTVTQVAQHDAPIKVCHWIKASNYQCLMTGGWDKTLRFWDLRSANPMHTIQMQERIYCADVVHPMAVVSTAGRGIIVYQLEPGPKEYKTIESPLKHQHRCIAIFKDKNVTNPVPTGYALGSIEGRVAIHYVDTSNPKDNFTFKCHRSPELINNCQEIYAVNDIAFHPTYGTLATVGSDGRFSFWDKDARTKLKTSERFELPVTRCCFNKTGEIFAYSVSYDWSKGHESYNPGQKNYIFLHSCIEDTKPRANKK